jgi:hypothetical protein
MSHSPSPPAKGDRSERAVETDTRLMREGGEGGRGGSRVGRGAAWTDSNPWVGGRAGEASGRGESLGSHSNLVVGGGAVHRAPRTAGATSVR